jgi:DNA-binding transcriptional ArsR family regulator
MIELELSVEDLGRIRFALSPLCETVTSLRTLSTNLANGWHSPWLRQVRPRLEALDLTLLTTVVRPVGYLPDFLLPPPVRRRPSIQTELAAITATPPPLVARELHHLAEHPLTQRGIGREGQALLRRLAADPAHGRDWIVAELRRYWQVALAPYWESIRALLTADLDDRLNQLAEGGLKALFSTLHPHVTFHGDTLRIVKYYRGRARLNRRGLVLVPSVFAWPDVIVRTADPEPILTYPARGLGRLWEPRGGVPVSPLAEVLGRSRAAILAQLALPMSTTQLAAALELTPPTVSTHLHALQAAGIVRSIRDGRTVVYRRTRLGEQLFNAAMAVCE